MSKKMKKQILASVRAQAASPETVFTIGEDFPFLSALADLVNCQGPDDYARLPPLGKLIVSLYALDMETENSGLLVYLEGPSGDFAEETRGYLRSIRADDLAGILDGIAARLPDGRIPAGYSERTEALEVLADEGDGFLEEMEDRYRGSGDKLIPLLRAYLEQRQTEVQDLFRTRASA